MKGDITRHWCLVDGEYHSIDEIYDVIDGKQINIPEQLEKYRTLTKKGKLLCDCGCGAKLMIVAGPREDRAQHFRAFPHQEDKLKGCKAKEETEETYLSRIYLNDWLMQIWDLQKDDIRHNVALSTVSEEKRGYRFTHYINKKNFGICYAHLDRNLDSEKIDSMFNEQDKKVLCIVDYFNGYNEGQYPEYLMRVQKRQNFCVLLDVFNTKDYKDARIKIVNYQKNIDGIWEEILMRDGNLLDFSLDDKGELLFRQELISEIVSKSIAEFETLQEEVARKRQEEKEAEELKERLREQKRKEIEAEGERNRDDKVRILEQYIHNLRMINGYFQVYSYGSWMLKKKEIRCKSAEIQQGNLEDGILRVRLHIKDYSDNSYYIYMERSVIETDKVRNIYDYSPYMHFPLYWFKIEDVIPKFRARFEEGQYYRFY